MDLSKNYPWTKKLPVGENDFQKWQAGKTKESFVFWSLKNKLISPKAYFDWAGQHYQIPFLKNMFFEQNPITKTEWDKVKDLSDWTEEKCPVALWRVLSLLAVWSRFKNKILSLKAVLF